MIAPTVQCDRKSIITLSCASVICRDGSDAGSVIRAETAVKAFLTGSKVCIHACVMGNGLFAFTLLS